MNLHEALNVISRYGLEIAPPRRTSTTRAEAITAIISGTTGCSSITRKPRRPVTDEAIDTAIRMHNNGDLWKEIEAATGHKHSALRRYMDV